MRRSAMKTKLNSPKIFLSILVILIQSCGQVSEALVTPANPGGTPLAPGTEPSNATTLPQLSDIISLDNAQNLVEISSWGKGSGHYPTYSPDGNLLAVSSGKGIYIYDSQTLQESMFFSAERVFDMAFSADGKTLSAASGDPYNGFLMQQWDLAGGSEIHSSNADSDDNYYNITGVLSPDGKWLALIFDGETVKLWDVASGQELHSLSIYEPDNLAFSADGGTLAASSYDGVTLYDVSSGSPLRTLRTLRTLDFEFPYTSRSAFSPDGKTLAIAGLYDDALSDEFTVALLDLASGRELLSFKSPVVPDMGGNPVFSFTFSPDGRMLASGSAVTIKVWDAASGNELLSINESNVESLTFSADSQTLVSSSSVGDDSVKLWDVQTGDQLNTIRGEDVGLSIFSSDSNTLAYASPDNIIRLRDARSGDVRTLRGHTDSVIYYEYSPDGKTLASASLDDTIKLWDVASGSELHTLGVNFQYSDSMAFSPDGKTLATGTDDNTVKLWDVSNGSELRTLNGHTDTVSSVAFSPDVKTLATASYDNTVKLWDLAGGSELRTLSGHTDRVTSVAFSPDGKKLVSMTHDGNKLWDVSSGQELASLSAIRSYSIFSPDGKVLATLSEDGIVRVLDSASGDEIYTLSIQTDRVFAMAFSPDGKILATGTGGDYLKLWDTASGQELASLNTGTVYSLAFSPDGRLIVVLSSQGTSLWGIQP